MFPLADVIPSRRRPCVTIGLIAVNVLVFTVALLAGELPRLIGALGMLPARFSWPDVLSSMFVHARWLPLLANMLYLWIFGDNVEDRLGRVRYLALYLACGTAAAIGQAAADPYSSTPVVGASGAVSGVLGAYFVLYPQSRVLTAVFLIAFFDLVEIPAAYFLGFWFLAQFLTGESGPGVHAWGGTSILADVAGFAVGAAGGWLWRGRIRYP